MLRLYAPLAPQPPRRIMRATLFWRICGALGLALTAPPHSRKAARPTEQLGKYPGALRQEAEQQRAREREQQQQQSGAGRPALRRRPAPAAVARGRGRGAGRGGTPAVAQRPPLASSRTRFSSLESLGPGKRGNTAGVPPELARLVPNVGGITGALCDSMLGRGTIEFRRAAVRHRRDGRDRASTAPSTAAAARASSCSRKAARTSRT